MKNVTVVFLIALIAAPVLLFDAASAVGPDRSIVWQGRGAGQVEFSGRVHAEQGYGCNDCHPTLFSMEKRSTEMSMDAMNQREFCGACHNGTTAFGVLDPYRCSLCHK